MEKSSFNRLSGELRNRIYEFALVEPCRPCCAAATEPQECTDGIPLAIDGEEVKAARVNICKHVSQEDEKPKTVYSRPASYGLTRTCRQIRRETRQLYFHVNDTLSLYPVKLPHYTDHQEPASQPTFYDAAVQKWLSITGQEKVCRIRHVKVWIVEIPSQPRSRAVTRFHELLESLKRHLSATVTISLHIETSMLGSFIVHWEDKLLDVGQLIFQAGSMARSWEGRGSVRSEMAIREQDEYWLFLRAMAVRFRTWSISLDEKERSASLRVLWDERVSPRGTSAILSGGQVGLR